jgi:asparagine synthetase B (glutamine-hydrolysing)
MKAQLAEATMVSPSQADHFHVERVSSMIRSAMTASGRVAARFATELRDPWADLRVVEFFLELPLGYKVRDGWTKYLVRTTFREELPAGVRWRTDKRHLGWKCTERLMEESREFVDHLIRDDIEIIRDYVDVHSVREVYERYLATSDPFLRDSIFQLATLISWLNRVNSLATQRASIETDSPGDEPRQS